MHFYECKTFSVSLAQPDKHHRVGFILAAIVPWQWSEKEKFAEFFLMIFASQRH